MCFHTWKVVNCERCGQELADVKIYEMPKNVRCGILIHVILIVVMILLTVGGSVMLGYKDIDGLFIVGGLALGIGVNGIIGVIIGIIATCIGFSCCGGYNRAQQRLLKKTKCETVEECKAYQAKMEREKAEAEEWARQKQQQQMGVVPGYPAVGVVPVPAQSSAQGFPVQVQVPVALPSAPGYPVAPVGYVASPGMMMPIQQQQQPTGMPDPKLAGTAPMLQQDPSGIGTKAGTAPEYF